MRFSGPHFGFARCRPVIDPVKTNAKITKNKDFCIAFTNDQFEAPWYADFTQEIAVISTYNWSPSQYRVNIICSIIDALTNLNVDLEAHNPVKYCLSDFCASGDMTSAYKNFDFYPECANVLKSAVREGKITYKQKMACYKIADTTAGKKYAFVIMPLKTAVASKRVGEVSIGDYKTL